VPPKGDLIVTAPARTIVYVHGIGNKPPASVLKCQWDHALFDFDLGERSRLAYWVSREYYPEPAAGTCESGDLTEGEEVTPGGPAVRALAALPLEEEVAALTRDKGQQQVLLGLARAVEARGEGMSEAAVRARAVEAKVLPLPAAVRKFLFRRLSRAFVRDLHDLFFVPARREAMRESVLERLRPKGGPFVVIAHSQGSLVAYDVLSRLDPAEFDVALFVTVGSPLGVKEFQDQVKILTGQKRLAVPACARAWLNVADPLDPVALDKGISGEFKPHDGVKVEDNVEFNRDSPKNPHSGTGYLRTKPVRNGVRRAVDTALFQPVASFVIARDVTRSLEDASPEARHEVLIELAEVAAETGRPLDEVRERVKAELSSLSRRGAKALEIEPLRHFVAAKLTREETETLACRLGAAGAGKAVKRVWRNASKRALLEVSVNTVQARPAHVAYHARGQAIDWAILDTGIEAKHPHFDRHKNLAACWDCTRLGEPVGGPAYDQRAKRSRHAGEAADAHGHGTHVAGIIAGRHQVGERELSGVAPEAKLHVYKVLDDEGGGKDSWIVKGLDHVFATNERAGRPVIQGVNLSLGGGFDPSVYACGHSPLCGELRRLWRQGVLVVIAAGNEGHAVLASETGPIEANMDLSIGDPANLEEAIVVGSVHKENPHTYGISYFSSRGPTADGRQKPDLVAPGERILSCRHRTTGGKTVDGLYVEMSGTSMAAPHVSGLLAAFLSIRREFIGYPDRVKEILLASCTDLRRDAAHQGAGLPNLVKMLVST
jgi:hypothetical protein